MESERKTYIVRRIKPQPNTAEGGIRGVSLIHVGEYVRGNCPQNIRLGDRKNGLK